MAIPNYHFEKYGKLLFLLRQKNSSFTENYLNIFKNCVAVYIKIHCNVSMFCGTTDINIENKSVYWKAWRDKNVIFLKDLLNDRGNYLSLQKYDVKYNIKVNILQYHQLISAIPTHLKSEASASVPARVRHCENPAKDREMAPTKSVRGPLWPFPFLIAWT